MFAPRLPNQAQLLTRVGCPACWWFGTIRFSGCCSDRSAATASDCAAVTGLHRHRTLILQNFCAGRYGGARFELRPAHPRDGPSRFLLRDLYGIDSAPTSDQIIILWACLRRLLRAIEGRVDASRVGVLVDERCRP
jgi:hypothetical protein